MEEVTAEIVQTTSQESMRNVALLASPHCGKTSIEKVLCGRTSINGHALYWKNQSQQGIIRLATSLKGSSEFRIYDGAILVVDCTQGFTETLKNLIVQTAVHRLEVVCIFNKLDSLLLSGLSIEEGLNTLLSLIQNLNHVLGVCGTQKSLKPEAGNVLFCSALLEFALDIKVEWTTHSTMCTVLQSLKEQLISPLGFLRFKLPFLISLRTGLISLIVDHLPSPASSSHLRASMSMNEEILPELRNSLLNSDPNGPLLAFVAKSVQYNKNVFAVVRVLSGTLRTEQELFAFRESDGDRMVLYMIEGISWTMEPQPIVINEAQAGSIVLIPNNNLILCSGVVLSTVSELRGYQCHVRPAVFTASATVSPLRATDMPQLHEAIRLLKVMEANIAHSSSDSERLLASDLPTLLDRIETLHTVSSVPLLFDSVGPIYRESISRETPQVYLTKSANKHTRLYYSAEQMEDELTSQLETHPEESFGKWNKRRAVILSECGSVSELIDDTKAVQYVNEIYDPLVRGFEFACNFGVLCDENIRGMRLKLKDVMLCADSLHRGPGQIIPAIRRATYACLLLSSPVLLEPVYRTEIVVPSDQYRDVLTFLSAKSAGLISQEPLCSPKLMKVVAELPFAQTVGLRESLEVMTSGFGLANLELAHWHIIPGDVLDPNTEAGDVVRKLRFAKGLRTEIPEPQDFFDRL